MSVTYTDILSRFSNPVKTAAGQGINQAYKVTCPCHADKQQSLVISEARDGKILLHDHAGCSTENILAAIGLKISDLYDGGKGSNQSWKTGLEWYYANKYEWNDEQGSRRQCYGEGVKVTAEYRYYNTDGEYQYSKIRIEGGAIPGKLIRYRTVIGDTASPYKPVKDEGYLYNITEFLKLRSLSQYAYIVEGEKDAETLKKLKQGFSCCVTPGGASDWRSDYAKYFKGLNVIILRDNDNAGLKFAERILKDLKTYAYHVKVVNPSQLDHGDVTDYLTKEGGTAQTLKDLCNKVTEGQYAAWVKLDNNGRESGINPGILAEAISRNERYLIIRNPHDDKDDLMLYRKGVYESLNKPGIKAMIRDYIPTAKVTDALLNNTCNLLFATNENIHDISELNADQRYINFKNGLYDIRNKALIPHNPDICFTIQYGFNYDPDNTACETFRKYIRDLCSKPDGSVDEGEIRIIQEYLGFIISNEPVSKIKRCLVLWSRQGNSGKSVLIRLVTNMIGLEKVASIKLIELKADNRFIMGSLPQCRVVACGDESNSNVTDSSIFKSITGGDPVKIEEKGKQGYSYIYRGGFMIACNGLPCFTDDKDAVLKRLLILPCEHHITPEKKDPELDDKLKLEIPGIMNWCLEGLYRLIGNHYIFSDSESSTRAIEEYRSNTDNVYRFLTENYIITGDYNDRISKKDFDDRYHKWASSDNTIRMVDRKNLTARMECYGISTTQGNTNSRRNIYIYRGIKEKPLEFEDVTDEELADIPF